MTPEGRVKAAIKKYLRTVPRTWFYFPVQNGRGVIGIPDIVGCCDGKFFALEVKAPGKMRTLTPNQLARINEIRQAHGEAWVVESVEMVEGIFRVNGWAK